VAVVDRTGCNKRVHASHALSVAYQDYEACTSMATANSTAKDAEHRDIGTRASYMMAGVQIWSAVPLRNMRA